jgi:hypothetical protein
MIVIVGSMYDYMYGLGLGGDVAIWQSSRSMASYFYTMASKYC